MAKADKALSGNKGEWSEIYTFFKVLTDGKLDVADDNLNAVPGEYYKIIEILRKENERNNHYVRLDDHIHIVVPTGEGDNAEELDISIEDFAKNSKLLFNYLKTKSGRSLKFPDIEKFMSELRVHSIKDVGNKRDITIKIEDFHSHVKDTLGFSIKSLIGKDSTLFNAGTGTNFIFEVKFPDANNIPNVDEFNKDTYNDNRKIGSRLTKLQEKYGASIVFRETQSKKFQRNLQLVDSFMPRIIAEALMTYYKDGISSVSKCIAKLTELNPLGFDMEDGQPFYEYKMRRFLQDAAMGLYAETTWMGVYDATGGQIIVKDDGDIVCFHIYEQNRFLNFLMNSTRFEQAATSENADNPGHAREQVKGGKTVKPFKFGWLYEDDGKYYIKLNLQIRMKDTSH